LLRKNRKKLKYSMTHPRINCKEDQIKRIKLQEADAGKMSDLALVFI